MYLSEPTYLGIVSAVTGSSVIVEIAPQLTSGIVVIGGRVHRIGQVGSFVRIPQGYNHLYGVIFETSEAQSIEEANSQQRNRRWVRVELVGEVVGSNFERGIGQYPSINDDAHIVTDRDLALIYGRKKTGQIIIGKLSSSAGIDVSVDLEKLITRHSAVLGSTGSGKSTSVASILRSIVCDEEGSVTYPSSRVILIDLHGEYSSALGDLAKTFSVSPDTDGEALSIPFWCVSPYSLIDFLCGQVNEKSRNSIIDRICEAKKEFRDKNKDDPQFGKIEAQTITASTPIPFSLKKLWQELSFDDQVTWSDRERTEAAVSQEGNIEKLVATQFEPPGSGTASPFRGGDGALKRSLDNFKGRMLDQQYSFLLSPGPWDPTSDDKVDADLGELLELWLGHDKSITILDLSGIPSVKLELLLGTLLDILFETALWGRFQEEGMRKRPLLLVLEEAHRYLSKDQSGLAKRMVKRIAKEGRKFGLGTMLVSQRPSEIDQTILSQCGTFFALRINNQSDRAIVKSAMSEGLSSIVDSLPVLRTGEAIIAGESAKLPMRCKLKLPPEGRYPDSVDPEVARLWSRDRRKEDYSKIAVAWRNQDIMLKKRSQ